MTPAELDQRVEQRLADMEAQDVVGRIWARDHTVWKPDPTEIADRLGWLTVAEDMRAHVKDLESFGAAAAGDGFTNVLLLGMGGSSLAPEVLRIALGVAPGGIDLAVLDTTNPAAIIAAREQLDLSKTLFIVASKSGTTVETLSHLAYFESLADPAQFVAITDPGSSLERAGKEKGFRRVFLNPADIGGRYSALSLFGLVPAALIGADLEGILDEAEYVAGACRVGAAENPGARLGALMGEAALGGRDKMTLVIDVKEFGTFGAWVEQLIAESTGKEGKAVLPVVGEELGKPAVYGSDRAFVSLGRDERLDDLSDVGHPVTQLEGVPSLGREFFRWEFATAVAGHILGINPFDQPNVAEAKQATQAILDQGLGEDPGFDDLGALLKEIHPRDYVAIQAFLEPSPETSARLDRVRREIRDRYHVATTVGFGPRYLHSTGQLHKGGPPTGVFIQVVDGYREDDLAIPGAPYTFGTLVDAQALGDLRALRKRGRRVARVKIDALEEAF
jgi:glucose-6-phosphate isomerase